MLGRPRFRHNPCCRFSSFICVSIMAAFGSQLKNNGGAPHVLNLHALTAGHEQCIKHSWLSIQGDQLQSVATHRLIYIPESNVNRLSVNNEVPKIWYLPLGICMHASSGVSVARLLTCGQHCLQRLWVHLNGHRNSYPERIMSLQKLFWDACARTGESLASVFQKKGPAVMQTEPGTAPLLSLLHAVKNITTLAT